MDRSYWPRVSPKKTWSGFIGGTLAGVCAGYAVALAFWGTDYIVKILAAAAVASVAAQLGDLGKSAFKRHWSVKNSSQLIPGHGGFMDRLDGFWAASCSWASACWLAPHWRLTDRGDDSQ